jgi:phosphoserine phosphatase
VTWSFAAQCVADRFGFSAFSGTVMHVDGNGVLAGRVAQHFEPEDKVGFLRDYCDARGLRMDQIVAVGDGRSDLPMFAATGFSVALNASPAARAAASVAVESRSFLDAPRAVPGLLDARSAPPRSDRNRRLGARSNPVLVIAMVTCRPDGERAHCGRVRVELRISR